MSTLDNLSRKAKHWLRALRAGEHPARVRYAAAYPGGPADPGLRDVQHALAREMGYESWIALKDGIAARQILPQPAHPVSGSVLATHEERVATFLDYACWDHRTHGAATYASRESSAMRLLTRHPEIATDSLYTAIVCGHLAEVERILSADPDLARTKGGPRNWEPLLYLSYSRLPLRSLAQHAPAIASRLLDLGANPNAYYMAGDAVYSALVGVAGEGEQDAPRDHPYKEALYRLLLERGAGPYDIQVLYNTHFSFDLLWWLELTYQHDLRRGDLSAWKDPLWDMLGMGGYGSGAYFLISRAVRRNDLRVARWVLEHGADPNALTYSHPRFKAKRSHYEEAVLNGYTELAELLGRYGAARKEPVLDEKEAFVAACFRLDRDEVERQITMHPGWRQEPFALFAAARRDRADVVALLLDLGVPIEIESPAKERALHIAAGEGALNAAQLLIERGAEIDPVETSWNGTPIGWASYGNKRKMVEFLTPLTRKVSTLTWLGAIDRLREVLDEDPALAREVNAEGATPLMWLPDDERKAAEAVDLLLRHGADPAVRSKEGLTAADYAMRRGLDAAALKLSAHHRAAPVVSTRPPEPEIPPTGMIEPIEVRTGLRMRLRDGTEISTVDMWNMLMACRGGDLPRVRELVLAHPLIAVCDYNYMPPIHLAVREGHMDIVRLLAEHGAVNPKYLTYPYREPLAIVARDRGAEEIAAILEEYSRIVDPDRPEEEGGEILYDRDEERIEFQKLVNHNATAQAARMLEKRPELALDEFASWGEGILMMPANRQNRDLLELLLSYGARVPSVTKWGAEYYFKHTDIAGFLLERGASARHMNCHHTTVLHHYAYKGEVDKVALLLDHGADIDAVDEEFRSTPLGLAARFGRRAMVDYLLERGADPRKSAAPWGTPFEWARKKGHADVVARLART